MKLWIVIYSHRYGVDVWPMFQDLAPDLEVFAEQLDDFEPERDEYFDLQGPFDVPQDSFFIAEVNSLRSIVQTMIERVENAASACRVAGTILTTFKNREKG